ncbi:MAG: trypsin-like peptidase domain-containing protein [Thermoleophilia bacterium]|jgi:2-alkenal reductase|nr:trypsin-like peptidase domain-containing protein [Thermoleophilia bacterium]
MGKWLATLTVGVVVLVAVVVVVVGDFGDGDGDDRAGTPQATAAGDFDPVTLYQESSPSVVLVLAQFDTPGGEGRGLGSGFVADDEGHIITNAHVVTADGVTADRVDVVFLRGETEQKVPTEVVGVDQSTDIAVLRVDPGQVEVEPIPLGDSDAVLVGQPVIAIGNPLGFSFSLSSGVVSGVGRNLQAPNGAIIPEGIQTDAAINQGNSGGPLIGADGRVVGVNVQIASTTGGFTGLGFAVPVNTAAEVLRQFVEEGDVEHAYLGIQGQTLTPGLAETLGLPVAAGVLVAEVVPGGPAGSAGLRGGDRQVLVQGIPYIVGGDVVTAIDGEPVQGMEELGAAVAQASPGDRWELTVQRDGEELRLPVTLGVRPG